jgi:hypothetical protein
MKFQGRRKDLPPRRGHSLQLNRDGRGRQRTEDQTIKIVVIGGSGLIGIKVVSNLRQNDFEVVAAAPNTGVNTITGG